MDHHYQIQLHRLDDRDSALAREVSELRSALWRVKSDLECERSMHRLDRSFDEWWRWQMFFWVLTMFVMSALFRPTH